MQLSYFFIFFVGGKGNEEAAENRNYLAGRMTDEINEIIRVLQLTTYDEDEWDADQLTAMKRACNALESKLQTAIDWLEVIRFILKYELWFYLFFMIFIPEGPPCSRWWSRREIYPPNH